MKIIYSVLLTIIATTFSISNLYAVRATPYPINFTQQDGTEHSIYLRGNEYFHYKTTLDGYVLTTDAKGILTYADMDSNGNMINTNVKASNIEKRSAKEREILLKLKPNIYLNKKPVPNRVLKVRSANTETSIQTSYPLTGAPKSLVILVNFTDKSFVTSNPKAAFTNLLNQDGYSTNGGTGSANNYFKDNSMRVFDPDFDVVGPYILPKNMAYYGANDASENDTNPQQMVIDACTQAAANGVDFSQYDTDHDGVVDNVFIYYAGYNEAEGGPANSVWPHRWSLVNNNTRFNGVSIFDYACTSELRGSFGSSMCGIGTFCHEFGHVLGLDDMYVTDSSIPDHYTLSSWDIMDYGPYLNSGRTPPNYSSYERFYLDWLKPIELKVPQQVTLDTLATSNKAYLISQYGNHNFRGSNPNPVEFFMLENRQLKGWDTYLPGHGMLVSHIYYNSGTWAANTPNNDPKAMGVDIIEADGIGSNSTMSGDPFPGKSNVRSFLPTLRSGTIIYKPISEIDEINGKIIFNFMGGTPPVFVTPPVANNPKNISLEQFDANWNIVPKASGYYLTVYNVSSGNSEQTQGFRNGLKAPIGWSITATGTTNSTVYSGDSIPAIQLKNTGEYIQTEQYVLQLSGISFYIRSLGENNGLLYVDAFDSTKWKKIDSIQISSSLTAIKEYTFNANENYIQYRLTYKKGNIANGSVIIDDMTAKFAKKLEFNAQNMWVTSNSKIIYNIVPERDYFYKVKASDITLYQDGTIKYENVTNFSNIIHFQLSSDSIAQFTNKNKSIMFYWDTNGIALVQLPDINSVVRIYNSIGQLIQTIEPTSLTVPVKNLKKGQLYIIQAGKNSIKIIY